MTAIHLSRHLVQDLYAEAQKSPSRPVSGLVGAKNGVAETIYPVSGNTFGDAKESLLKSGHNIFAVYHSYLDEPPVPNAETIANHPAPDSLALIISLNTKGVLELGGWKINQQPPEKVNLTII